MFGTLRKSGSRETWLASLRRIRERGERAPRHWVPRWTPSVALAALAGALFFAWAFLHILLILIFPHASPR